MIQRKKWIALLLAAAVALTGCGKTGGRTEATPTPIPTPIVPSKPTYEVQRGEVIQSLEFGGQMAPVTEEELLFRVGGTVAAIHVNRGDWVEEGDVLAELNVTDLKNQLTQAESALASAISTNEQRVVEAEAAVQAAELRLAITRAGDPEPQVVIAQVALERAQQALDEAQEEYDKAKNRPWEWQDPDVQDRYTSMLTEAERSLRIAEARHQEALQDRQIYFYNVQLREQDVTLAQLELQRLEAGFDVEQMQLTVQRLQDQLAEHSIIAPFDGEVLLVGVAEGHTVRAYQAAITLGDPGELEVSADLSTDQMAQLEEGMEVTCTRTNRPGEEITGKIRRLPAPYGGGSGRVTTIEDEDQSTRITLDVDAEQADLDAGDLLRVSVMLERKEDVLWLPPQAIRSFEGRRFVVVQEEEGQRRVDIMVGIEGEERVEIESGLLEGQIVVSQ